MKKSLIVIASALLLAVAAIKADEQHYINIDGNNDPRNGGLYLMSTAHIFTEYSGSGPNGPTYTQVRLDGVQNNYCAEGVNKGGGWCGDDAESRMGGLQYFSEARTVESSGIVPMGCYTSTALFYASDVLVANYPVGRCFSDPSPLPGDGYCVSYNYDSGSGQYVCNESPIVINTGKGQDYKFRGRVAFDLDADGVAELTRWTEPGSDVAFLAIDRNGDGRITSGAELFGNHTLPGSKNGFQALRAMANIEFGYVSADHAGDLFAKLLLWHDVNSNGISDAGELTPASTYLEAVGLGYHYSPRQDGAGNEYRYEGWARFKALDSESRTSRLVNAASREKRIFDVYLAKAQ